MFENKWIVLFLIASGGVLLIASHKDWWTHEVFYEIYVRSFKDTNGDGIGDLKGIINNLQHFVDSGVGAIWLSPIYESPMVDFGYDISDFYKISSDYGTMEDLEKLIAKAKDKGLKVILDFIPNHASNASQYFKMSENRTKGYEDFFVWDNGTVDPETNKTMPPSNWMSSYSESAWQWNEKRNQYYLHQFSYSQPDFNYRNPDVYKEMIKIMKFYLDKGVDGFRVDATPFLVEAKNSDGTYPDNPMDGNETIPIYTQNRNESYEIIYKFRSFLDEYSKKDGKTRVMLTEAYTNFSFVLKYYGNETTNGSHVPFNFDYITKLSNQSNAKTVVGIGNKWLDNVPHNQYPNWVLGNHDTSRVASRIGYNWADCMNMLIMLLPGIAVTYQGEEIGMVDGYVSYEDTKDNMALAKGTKDNYLMYSRDPERTPFQWDNTTNAGFSNAPKTWLPVAENYKDLNLKRQKNSNKSHYDVYKMATKARQEPTLKYGQYDLKSINNYVLALSRTLKGNVTYGMVMNMGNKTTVDVSTMRGFDDEMEIYVTNVDSHKNKGDTIGTKLLTLEEAECFMLKTMKPQNKNNVINIDWLPN